MAEQNELKEKLAADTAERRDLTWNSLIDQNVKMHKASPRLAFDIGYELAYQDGYAAGQPQWRPIRTADDLPKELDWYLFRDRLGGAKAELFNFQDWNMLNDITKGVFLMLYVAWQPIQPYTESDKGGK